MDEDIKVLEIADPAKQVGCRALRNYIDLVSANLTLLKLKVFCAGRNVDALPCPHRNQSANYKMRFQYSNLYICSPKIVPYLYPTLPNDPHAI